MEEFQISAQVIKIHYLLNGNRIYKMLNVLNDYEGLLSQNCQENNLK